MFEGLTTKFDAILKRLKGRGVLNEQNINDSLREVRLALLEADVNFKVVKDFIDNVKEKALGSEVMSSLTPGQQFIKIVHSELCRIMGERQATLHLSPNPPTIIMLVGLQGSGKTTTAGKAANYFNKNSKKVLLVPADTRRPAAVEQLTLLGKQLNINTYSISDEKDPVRICKAASDAAWKEGYDVAILDTAGRLHIDSDLMNELKEIKEKTNPNEILLVADAMTGQDAVNIAEQFNNEIGLTGVILTKIDGDARGGAVLSIKAVTGKPIKFVGTGEKLDALEVFHPERVASRILGMGDILSLIEKAEEALDQQQVKTLGKKLQSESFTLEDFLDQLRQIKKIGSLDQIISMIPGLNKLGNLSGSALPEKEVVKIEAIINSMTKKERQSSDIINGSRRKRIASGSGTQVQDVNRLLKQFLQMKKMMKSMMAAGGKGRFMRNPMAFMR
ncbi:MAG: signal recognition particle protein [Nitrospirae bacterium]|nr:signal recognition particle protein [Nitrospirota bacterium]